MNISRFFVDRPIFAGVISLLIFIAGIIAMFQLPISEYPEVSPPSVVVNASYPGANPKVIAETVARPLEEQMSGVENMLYMFSQATTDGRMTLTVTFKIGTDPDLAQQMVQNRVSQALPRLPEVTRQTGVTVVKSSPDLTMVVHLISPDKTYDELYLRNYALMNVKDELAKVAGVGMVRLFGSGDYAMRIWLDPEKIAERNLTASDITNAVREQNVQVAAGMIGGAPVSSFVDVQLPVNAKGRLENVEEFGEIIIRAGANGEITRLKDVARVELGAAEFSLNSMLDNQPADELDSARAEAQLELTRAAIPNLQARIDLSINRLAVLSGVAPETLRVRLATPQALPSLPTTLAVGDPVSLLQRRPDIQAAEQALKGAVAEYNVRVADLYPRISLDGSLGYLSTDWSRLGEEPTETFVFAPTIRWAAFNLSRVQAQINAADARAQARLAQFEQSV